MATKDVTYEERNQMNELLGDMGAIQRVLKINHDSHTAQQLNQLYTEAQAEYDGFAERAKQAARERMARARAAKATKADHEGGEANG